MIVCFIQNLVIQNFTTKELLFSVLSVVNYFPNSIFDKK